MCACPPTVDTLKGFNGVQKGTRDVTWGPAPAPAAPSRRPREPSGATPLEDRAPGRLLVHPRPMKMMTVTHFEHIDP